MSLMLVDARIVTVPVLVYNAIGNIITSDVAASWLLDRLVGLDLLLKSKRS